MKYMTDAHLANVSQFLKSNRVNCETVHQYMKGNEDSQVQIYDPEIVQFLMKKRSEGVDITLICNDKDLAGHCRVQNLPVIFLPYAVLTLIKELESK